MIIGLISDPSFIPVSIVFALFVLFAYWQNLNNYIIHLSIVYLAFIIVTAMSYDEFDKDDVSDANLVLEDSSNNIINEAIELSIESTSQGVNKLEPSAPVVVKEYIPKEEKIDNSPKTISVRRLIVCENINFNLRKPIRIRDTFLDTTSKIYCFAGIKNPDKSENISHYWEYEGESYAKVYMNISVSEYFRCWSYISPGEGSVGQWSVSVIDDQNNVLERQEFTIEPYVDSSN
jgi:hypothetical protein|tara:strand:- start:908 stop:1606 length:699 start_codon:yes stop_codon:yes gene_type:complete